MNNESEINNEDEKPLSVSYARNFHYRSEEAQEIISRKPGFIEKWALLLFMAILVLLICGTWFIKYPDILETRATLTGDNAPKEIITYQAGRLIQLFTKNGDEVKKGEPIAWLETTANTQEVLTLSGKLDSALILLGQNKPEALSGLFGQPYQHLGELQSAYQVFNTVLQQYNDYLVNGFYSRKKNMLLSDMNTLAQMNSSFEKQKNLTAVDMDSAEKTLKMNKYLLDEKIISPQEYRAEISKNLSKQMALPQINTSILSNQNQQRDKLKELELLDHDVKQQTVFFEQALETFKSNTDAWLHLYTISSPLDGKIFFTMQLQQNKFVTQGKILGYINPVDNNIYAEVYLPQNNFGKADTGMQVQLRFDAYPYQEAGFVKGKLNYISSIATDSGFLATVSLDNGLQTSNKRTIPYKNGLKAEALVITRNLRFLQRLYYNIVKSTSIGK